MIVPVHPKKRFTFKELREAIQEANRSEDDDFLQVPFSNEECPICEDENELRQFVRTEQITRKITSVTVHCTASHQTASVSAILNIWKRKGWRNPGYHVLLPVNGFTIIADFNSISNGAIGYNTHGLHISYIGGVTKEIKPVDNRTSSQRRLIDVFLYELIKRFPDIRVIGHNEVARKACPCFKVKHEYTDYWTGI